MQVFDMERDHYYLLGNVLCELNGKLAGYQYIELVVCIEQFSDKPPFFTFYQAQF